MATCTGGQAPCACPLIPCGGCPRIFIYPPVYQTNTIWENMPFKCEHLYRFMRSDTAGEHYRCDKCGDEKVVIPFPPSSTTLGFREEKP